MSVYSNKADTCFVDSQYKINRGILRGQQYGAIRVNGMFFRCPDSLDLLFRERGFEFYWEMLRRTDIIRLGEYEGTWTGKTNSDVRKRIFPIPRTAIDGVSNLPGYLLQNEGY